MTAIPDNPDWLPYQMTTNPDGSGTAIYVNRYTGQQITADFDASGNWVNPPPTEALTGSLAANLLNPPSSTSNVFGNMFANIDWRWIAIGSVFILYLFMKRR